MATESPLDPVLERVMAQVLAKQRATRLRQLVATLCAELQIPPGRELVPLLTARPHTYDNEEAVCAWLNEQLTGVDDADAFLPADTLRGLLILKLESLTREFS